MAAVPETNASQTPCRHTFRITIMISSKPLYSWSLLMLVFLQKVEVFIFNNNMFALPYFSLPDLQYSPNWGEKKGINLLISLFIIGSEEKKKISCMWANQLHVSSLLVCVFSIHDTWFLLHGPLLCSYSNLLSAQPPKSTLRPLLLSGMPWLIGRFKLLRKTETPSGLGFWSPTGLAQWLTCTLRSAQMKRAFESPIPALSSWLAFRLCSLQILTVAPPLNPFHPWQLS